MIIASKKLTEERLNKIKEIICEFFMLIKEDVQQFFK